MAMSVTYYASITLAWLHCAAQTINPQQTFIYTYTHDFFVWYNSSFKKMLSLHFYFKLMTFTFKLMTFIRVIIIANILLRWVGLVVVVVIGSNIID